MLVNLIILLSLLIGAPKAETLPTFVSEHCESLLQEATPQTLIEVGLERGLIASVDDLVAIHESLVNEVPVRLAQESHSTQRSLFLRSLQAVVDRWGEMESFRAWLGGRVQVARASQDIREVVKFKTANMDPSLPEKFVTIKAGTYLVPELLLDLQQTVTDPTYGKLVPIELSYDFEVLTTPVTQGMWLSLMGEMPKDLDHSDTSYIDRADLELIRMKGKDFEIAPNHPVTHVSFASAAEFANRLSRMRAFKVAYERLKFAERPEDGTALLKSVQVQGRVGEIQGYRLLTHVEWVILVAKAISDLETMSDVDRRKAFDRWAWLESNSASTLHAVATRQPMQTPGGFVFDLLGLVREQLHPNRFKERSRTVNYTMIEPIKAYSYLETSAGCISTFLKWDVPFYRGGTSRCDQPAGRTYDLMGFRLARTL